MKVRQKKYILVVCHDAGTAEAISAYVKKYAAVRQFVCLVAGPAIAIFRRKRLRAYLLFSPAKAQELLAEKRNILFVLAGTSWGSSLELDFIKAARQQQVRSVAYLEHWVNIRERFNYPKKDWKNNLPDAFWADNTYTRDLARKFFTHIPCTLVPNLYYQEMQEEYKKVNKQISGKRENIVFMSQPIAVGRGPENHSHLFTFSEFDILEHILQHATDHQVNQTVVVCYHPSEKKNKYDRLVARYADKVHIVKQSGNRLKDIARARAVIGISSTILVIAKQCDRRKKVVSFIPDAKTPFPIPFKNIVRIRNSKQLARALAV